MMLYSCTACGYMSDSQIEMGEHLFFEHSYVRLEDDGHE